MDRTFPRVAALVPTYNGAPWIEETLACLAAQDYPALAVVISDDRSDDGTWELCRRWTEERAEGGDGPDVRCFRQPRRLGWIGNSNALLESADAELAFFAPQDDLFEPTYVSTLAEALETRPDAVVAYADRVDFDDKGFEAVRSNPALARPDGVVRRGIRYVPTLYKDRDLPFRGLVRTSALRSSGLLSCSRIGEFEADARWVFRLALAGPFVHVPEPLARKRWHTTSLNRSWSYTRKTWRRATLAYLPEIRQSRLPAGQQLALSLWVLLQASLWFLPGRQRYWIRWRMQRLDRR